jgi:hypothetical protein
MVERTMPTYIDGQIVAYDGNRVPTPFEVLRQAAEDPAEGTKLKDFEEILAQSKYELDLMRKVPEMKTQRASLAKRLEVIEKCRKASEAGFALYSAPSGWSYGFLSRPSWNMKGNYSLYHRAMPLKAIEALAKAKRLGIFDVFTVHSADGTAFFEQPARPPARSWDPVLVGHVNTAYQIASNGNFAGLRIDDPKVGERYSFLLSAWDLATDLKYNTMQIEAPKG